jgi:hypothetical protein
MKHLAGACIFVLAFAFAPADGLAQDGGFHFGVIGDMPYSLKGIQKARRVITALNKAKPAFVIHIGDFQSGNPNGPDPKPCSDKYMDGIRSLFGGSASPFILTPGDNDWTDCGRGDFDPLDRLAKVRSMFFPKGKSLGRRTMAVESQGSEPAYSKFVENLTWKIGGVIFVTLHIVGSDDNSTSKKQSKGAEHKARLAANLAWMKKAFTRARSGKVKGLVIMAHANPRFENHWHKKIIKRYIRGVVGLKAKSKRRRSVYDAYTKALRKEMKTFTKPVLYVHGSTHIFRVNKPLFGNDGGRAFQHQNFTRLESFGNPDIQWVRVTVDPGYAGLFSIRPEIIPENRAYHR